MVFGADWWSIGSEFEDTKWTVFQIYFLYRMKRARTKKEAGDGTN